MKFKTAPTTAAWWCWMLTLVDPTRLLFGLMFLGTIMVTFFDRCTIARVLLLMPWNHRPGAGSTSP